MRGLYSYLMESTRFNVNRRLVFIINPIAGGRESASLKKILDVAVCHIPDSDIVYTKYPGHARELAASAVKDGYDVVVAVGGDGTVNEVASSLVGTDTALGIIPLGSGNGLARHLGIPLQPEKAIRTIMESKPITIDSATINGTPFFCTAGIGFDAQVAADYAKSGTRGLITYVKEAIKDWIAYKPGDYVIETENGKLQTKALLITIGNANQWGNDYFITPQASLLDGNLDIAIVKPASMMSNLSMVRQLRQKTLTENPNVLYIKSSYARIECLTTKKAAAHYDGEVASFDGNILFECKKNTMKIIPGIGADSI